MSFPEFDWNAAWIEAQQLRRKADDAAYWDMRAPSFSKTAGTSPYAKTFIERARIEPGETVFDMGCGSGTLALPLAATGHEVWAADFSSNMRELMMRRARIEQTDALIHPIDLAWDEEWDDERAPMCDLSFASRSIATSDMRRALEKLESCARRRVCITLATSTSPRCDEVLLQVMGRKQEFLPDYVFGMNILWSMGREPELSYIRSERSSFFASYDEAVEKTCMIVEADETERARLEAYARDHLLETVDESGEQAWSFDHKRVTSWAFIAWDKERQ